MTRTAATTPVCLALWGILAAIPQDLAAAAAGDRDPQFGNGGVALADLADTSFGRNSSALYLVRVQADGRIVGLGIGAGGGFVARWNADGTVDPTFGIQGISILPGNVINTDNQIRPLGLSLLPDGRILVAATVGLGDPQTTTGGRASVWRLSANGLPDLTWNGGRPFSDDSPTDGSRINIFLGVHPQADGSVLAIGQLNDALSVVKLTAAGQPDTTFAPAGRKVLTVANIDSLSLYKSFAQPDGRILVSGFITRPPNGNTNDGAFVARLTTAGAFDTSFDGDGYNVVKFGTPPDAADQLSRWWGQDIAMQSDGKILVSGSSYYGGSDKKQQSCVIRLTPSGAIDTAFGTLFSGISYGFIFNGKNANPDMAEGLLVQGDDRVITAGWNFPSSYVARHTADGRTRQFEVAPPTTGQGGWPGYWIHAIAQQGDGRIIAVGEGSTAGGDNRSLLMRVNTDGTRDATFGGGAPGLAPQPTARSRDVVSELLLVSDKPLVAAAVTTDATNGFHLTVSGLAAFTTTGGLDPAFSGDGRLAFRMGDAAATNAIADVPADMARDAQGRLLVIGPATAYNPGTGVEAPSFITLRRFLSDGSPDTAFASSGRAQFAAKGRLSLISAVAVQADGKPVVVTGSNGSTGTEVLLRRLTTTGAADSTFNGTGSVALTSVFSLFGTFQGDPVFARGVGIAITADGRILVAGRPVASGTNPKELQVARYTATGALDTSFGTNGYATVELGTGSGATNGYRFLRMRQMADGRILLVAERFLVRLTAAGVLDTTFNGTGILPYDPTAGVDTLASVAESGSQLFIVGTVGEDTAEPRIRVSRHSASGALDTTFGVGGVVERDVGTASDVEIQSNGGIIVAASTDRDAAVYRYLPDGTSAPITILADRTSVGVSEGGIATVGVRLGSAPGGTVTVNATLAGGGDPDLLVTGGSTLTFTTGNWNTFQAVTIAADEDADTSNGSATLVLSGAGLTGDSVAVAEIDNGLSPSQIEVTDSVVVPEGGNAQVQVRLTAAPTGTVVVAAAIQPGGDPNLSITGGATLTFTTSTWNTPQPVTVAAATDADAANGSAVLRLSAGGLLAQDVLLREADADTLPVASISAGGSVVEGGSVTITVTLSRAAAAPLSIGFAVDASGTAGTGDYTLDRTPPLTIPTGQTTAAIAVTTTVDGLAEAAETVRISLLPGSGYTLAGSITQAVVEIEDGAANGAGTLAFANPSPTVAEGTSGTTVATIPVQRTGGVAGAVSVAYATTNGTASAGGDYTAAGGTLQWADGDGAAKTITIVVAGDTMAEGNETVLVNLSNPGGGAVLGQSTATLTIVDSTPPNQGPVISTPAAADGAAMTLP